MMNVTPDYKTLANLLEYPGEYWSTHVAIARDYDSLSEFIDGIEKLSLSDLHELYTRTFDLNPACALEIGYHLFGENYKRGEFLANLRETEAPFDLGQENQLPDYLPVLLRLLTKLDDEELRASLIGECLIPAIEKMLTSLKESDNPYRYLLEASRTTLQSEVPIVSTDAPRFSMRANLPVLNESDLVFGFAAGCAVAALPRQNDRLRTNWGYAPDRRGIAPESKAIMPEGQRPSAHQAAGPQSEFVSR